MELHGPRPPTSCTADRNLLRLEVAFVITTRLKREEGVLVPILLFFIFVAVVALVTIGLGYGLSSVEEQAIGRRCWMPYEMNRRRKIRRQRVRCRY